MKFYEVTDQVGGEDIWLRRVASLYGQVPTLIWPKDKLPTIVADSIWNRFLLKFSLIVERVIPNAGRGLFLNFLFALYKLDDEIIFLSTTYIPVPRGKNVIAYIHTPSRAMTIDYHSTRDSFKHKSIIYRFLLSVLRFSYRVVYKFSLSHAKILLVNSLNVQKRVLDFVSVKAELCYPSQDTSSFYSREPENYFLLVSKIQPYKGHDFCLKAFKTFYEQNKNFKLIVISVSPKAEEELVFFKRISAYVSENRLPVEFRFDLGREEVIYLYSGAYLCLFCSRNEDLGQVPIEAMASSRPVVSVRGPGPSETIIDNVTGFLVDDEESMATKMLLLANDQSLSTQMGRNGRERAVNMFDDLRFKECLNRQLERI